MTALAGRYYEKVHFVAIYVVEAHPKWPDPSPFRGYPWTFEYSVVRQAMNYSARVNNSAMLPSLPYHTLLIDELTPHGKNNPFWCTYGRAADAAWLINQDGIVVESMYWWDYSKLEKALQALVGHGNAV